MTFNIKDGEFTRTIYTMVSRCDNYLIIKRTIGSCYTFKCQINEERFADAIAALIVIVETNPNVSFSSFNAEKMLEKNL